MASAISSLYVELALEAENFNNGLKEAQKQATEFEKTIRPSINAAKELGETMSLVGDLVAGAMIEATLKSAEYGANLQEMSEKSHASVESLAQLGFAAQQNGSSLEGLGNSLKFLSKNMELATDTSSSQSQAFSNLGITQDQLIATGGSSSAMFILLADKIHGMEDPTTHAADLAKILGKNWTEMLPTLELGSAGLKALAAEADRLGIVLDEHTTKSDLEFIQAMKEAGSAVEGLEASIGAALVPTLTSAVHSLTEATVAAASFTKEHQGLTQAAFDASAVIGALGGALLAIGFGAPAVIGGLESIAMAAEGMGIAISAAELGVAGLSAALGVGIGALINYEISGTAFEKLLDGLTGALINPTSAAMGLAQSMGLISPAADQTALSVRAAEDAVAKLGIAYDATGKSSAQILIETKDLIQAHFQHTDSVNTDTVAVSTSDDVIRRWQQSNVDAAAAGKAWNEELVAHIKAVDTLTGSVIPAKDAAWNLSAAIADLTAKGVPASTITKDLGKQAEDLTAKYYEAGMTIPAAFAAEIEALRQSYEYYQMVSLQEKTLDDTKFVAKTNASTWYVHLNDAELANTAANIQVEAAMNVAHIMQGTELKQIASAVGQKLDDSDYEHRDKTNKDKLASDIAYINAIIAAQSDIRSHLESESLTMGNITDAFFDHWHQGALTVGNVMRELGVDLASSLFAPLKATVDEALNEILKKFIDLLITPVAAELAHLGTILLQHLGLLGSLGNAASSVGNTLGGMTSQLADINTALTADHERILAEAAQVNNFETVLATAHDQVDDMRSDAADIASKVNSNRTLLDGQDVQAHDIATSIASSISLATDWLPTFNAVYGGIQWDIDSANNIGGYIGALQGQLSQIFSQIDQYAASYGFGGMGIGFSGAGAGDSGGGGSSNYGPPNPGGPSGNGGFADGLDYVPSEGFYHLHPGERVQTAQEAAVTRAGGGGAQITIAPSYSIVINGGGNGRGVDVDELKRLFDTNNQGLTELVTRHVINLTPGIVSQ